MVFQLHRHPQSTRCAGLNVSADLVCEDNTAVFRYRVAGAMEGDDQAIAIPDTKTSARKDGLWEQTCFEAFIGRDDGYLELNFSPSTQWAAYLFDGYRVGMRDALDITDVAIDFQSDDDGTLNLTARIALDALKASLPTPSQLALFTIVRQADDAMTYFALAHPDGDHEFHHGDCFAAQTPRFLNP